MNTHKLFVSNRSQAVRIPKSLAFDPAIQSVIITKSGNGILLTPVTEHWNDFFNQPPCPEFMPAGREQPVMQVRDAF